jgi:hypothetical protein
METKWCVVVGSFCVLRSGVFGALLFSDFFYSVAASREKRFVIFFWARGRSQAGARFAWLPFLSDGPRPHRRRRRRDARLGPGLGRSAGAYPPYPSYPRASFSLFFPAPATG